MKVGELFVDLGVNSGSAMNTLTNFSIKFLALKTAGKELANVFDGIFGDTTEYAKTLKIHNELSGKSVEWLQKMKYQAEQLGVPFENVIGTLESLQKKQAEILMGGGNISTFQKLNIDVSKMREPVELLDEALSKIMTLQPAFRQQMLDELGISKEIFYMYQQKADSISESLLLTKEEVDNLTEMQREWDKFALNFSALWDKTIAKASERIKEFLYYLNTFFPNEEKEEIEKKEIDKRAKKLQENFGDIEPLKDTEDYNDAFGSAFVNSLFDENQKNITDEDIKREYAKKIAQLQTFVIEPQMNMLHNAGKNPVTVNQTNNVTINTNGNPEEIKQEFNKSNQKQTADAIEYVSSGRGL